MVRSKRLETQKRGRDGGNKGVLVAHSYHQSSGAGGGDRRMSGFNGYNPPPDRLAVFAVSHSKITLVNSMYQISDA